MLILYTPHRTKLVVVDDGSWSATADDDALTTDISVGPDSADVTYTVAVGAGVPG